VSHAIDRMRKYKISQIPVIDTSGFVGSVDETDLFRSYVVDKNVANKPIREVMGQPFPVVKAATPIEEVSKLFSKDSQAVLVELPNTKYHIITKHDIIGSIK
jgi:cystathionine beta-synthase